MYFFTNHEETRELRRKRRKDTTSFSTFHFFRFSLTFSHSYYLSFLLSRPFSLLLYRSCLPSPFSILSLPLTSM